jgi:hypothetical protein
MKQDSLSHNKAIDKVLSGCQPGQVELLRGRPFILNRKVNPGHAERLNLGWQISDIVKIEFL